MASARNMQSIQTPMARWESSGAMSSLGVNGDTYNTLAIVCQQANRTWVAVVIDPTERLGVAANRQSAMAVVDEWYMTKCGEIKGIDK